MADVKRKKRTLDGSDRYENLHKLHGKGGKFTSKAQREFEADQILIRSEIVNVDIDEEDDVVLEDIENWEQVGMENNEQFNDEDALEFFNDEADANHQNAPSLFLNWNSKSQEKLYMKGKSLRTKQRHAKQKKDVVKEAFSLPKINSFLMQVVPGVEFSEGDDDDDEYDDGDDDDTYTEKLIQTKLSNIINQGNGSISKNVATQNKHSDVDKFGMYLNK